MKNESNGNKVAKNQNFISIEEQAKKDQELNSWLFTLNDLLVRLTDNTFFDECIEETSVAFFESIGNEICSKEVGTAVLRVLFSAKEIKAHIVNKNCDSEVFSKYDDINKFNYQYVLKNREVTKSFERLKQVESIVKEMQVECIDLIEQDERLIHYLQKITLAVRNNPQNLFAVDLLKK